MTKYIHRTNSHNFFITSGENNVILNNLFNLFHFVPVCFQAKTRKIMMFLLIDLGGKA